VETEGGAEIDHARGKAAAAKARDGSDDENIL
jgi:hypothetical protein